MDERKTDYEYYFKELNDFEKEPENSEDFEQPFVEEGAAEAQWLEDIDLGHLSKLYREGREISDLEVHAACTLLSKSHADAVERRIRTLNQTIRNKYRQQRVRHKKPDIRDLFKDLDNSSTGTRSRSATPDSLDSEEESGRSDWQDGSGLLRETEVVNSQREAGCSQEVAGTVLPGHELFARSGPHWSSIHRADVASDTEGVKLLGYQRFGTMHGYRWTVRSRSGSVPTLAISTLDLQNDNPVSFESFYESGNMEHHRNQLDMVQSSVEMLHMSDAESSLLKPLLWLELTTLFDKHSISFKKRMPYKKKLKENGNVFGVSLPSLVMRDRRIGADNSTVPKIFELLINQLENKYCKEEGILRIAGNKQRVESLCSQIELNFYMKPDEIHEAVRKSSCHELTSVLKKLLRELPRPLLTTELIDIFYRTHRLPDRENQSRALNLLVLLMPIECSGTLRILMSFLTGIVANEASNRMSLHNVAMIMAPSLFPPRHMHPHVTNENLDINAQLKVVADCCRVVEIMLHCGLDLWRIPDELWLQMQTAMSLHKSQGKEVLQRNNTHYETFILGRLKDRCN